MDTLPAAQSAIWPLSKLVAWDKNPRGIKEADYQRLKNQIQELGLYKPFVITPEGEVLGGNMRLKACRELGLTEVPVSIVNPTTEAQKVKYALSDNDRAGYYLDEQLAELITENGAEINLADFKIDLGDQVDLSYLLNNFSPGGEEDTSEREQDVDPTDHELDSYLNGTIRQIVLYFDIPAYETALEDLTEIRTAFEVEDNTAAFLKLVEYWKAHHNEPT